MTPAAASRARKIALAVAAGLLAALALYRWLGSREPPLPVRAGTSAPPPTAFETGPLGRPQPTPSPPVARPPDVATPRPRPSVFDFAMMTPPARTSAHKDEEQFPTTAWFTEEDLHHPERYFALAERMPELNRPEERHDTLEFFLAYRAKLARDLDAAGVRPDERQEILATVERYDSAIARLRTLIEGDR